MFVQRGALSLGMWALGLRGMSIQPSVMKKGAMHNYVDSLQDIVLPFIPPDKYASFFTKLGRSQRWEALRNFALNTYHAGKIKASLKGWTPLSFVPEADKTVLALNQAFAKGDLEAIRPLVTSKVHHELRNAILKRPSGVKLQYIDGGAGAPTRVVAMRHIPLPDDKSVYAQVTVRTNRLQSVARQDLKPELIASLEHKPFVEYVVFESCLSRPPHTWRICAKLAPKTDAPKAK